MGKRDTECQLLDVGSSLLLKVLRETLAGLPTARNLKAAEMHQPLSSLLLPVKNSYAQPFLCQKIHVYSSASAKKALLCPVAPCIHSSCDVGNFSQYQFNLLAVTKSSM
jgi:hypothetical protein